MASSNFRKTASMSCDEASLSDADPAPIQANTVIQPPEEEVDPQFTRIKYMGNNARVKMILICTRRGYAKGPRKNNLCDTYY